MDRSSSPPANSAQLVLGKRICDSEDMKHEVKIQKIIPQLNSTQILHRLKLFIQNNYEKCRGHIKSNDGLPLNSIKTLFLQKIK